MRRGAYGVVLLLLAQVAVEGADLHLRAEALGEQLLRLADLPGTGEKGQQIAALPPQGAQDRLHRGAGDGCAERALPVVDRDRPAAPPAHHHQRLQQPGHGLGIERRRHHQQAQILTQGVRHIPAQGQPQIGLEAALMEFVEDHQGDPLQRGVPLQAPGQNPLGHHLDPGRGADPAVETHPIADAPARRFPE